MDKKLEDEKLTLNQGFVKDADLEPEGEKLNVLPPGEIDRLAEEARRQIAGEGSVLQGEGNYEAAESYNEAATDFAQRQEGKK